MIFHSHQAHVPVCTFYVGLLRSAFNLIWVYLTIIFHSAAPQIAASQSGDCTFEVDECGWSNVGSRERLDDIDWERTSGAALRNTAHDHTLGTEKGKSSVKRNFQYNGKLFHIYASFFRVSNDTSKKCNTETWQSRLVHI